MKYERLTESKNYSLLTKNELFSRLHRLEDKIENGTLVELPCKAGDMAYYVTKHENDYVIEFGYVKSISIERGGIWFACHYNSGLNYWHNYKDNYGSLFFNFAEAEKKLKELQGE